MKQLLDAQPHKIEIFHDTGDGKFHVETRFDCQPALDAAQRARDVGHNSKSNMKLLAEVPMWLIHLSIKEGWYNDSKKWRLIFKEYSKFQVHKD